MIDYNSREPTSIQPLGIPFTGSNHRVFTNHRHCIKYSITVSMKYSTTPELPISQQFPKTITKHIIKPKKIQAVETPIYSERMVRL